MRMRFNLQSPPVVVLALVLTVVALLLRLAWIGTFPPGLHHDEAWNGLDELDISSTYHPIFFPHSNGREPLFLYIQAVSLAIFGPTPAALRATAGVMGALTVLVTVYAGRAITGSTATGALAGFFTTFSFWHLLDSRLGFRATMQPLLMTLALWLLWEAWHRASARPSRFLLLAGGACIGLTAYTYIASRIFPLVLFLWFLWRVTEVRRDRRLQEVTEWMMVAATALIVVSPLALYFVGHHDEFLGRASQVVAFGQTPTGATVSPLTSTLRTLGMFSIEGDTLWKFNIAGKPVFDWPMSVLFYAGIGLAIAALTHRKGVTERPWPEKEPRLSAEAGWLLLVWIAVMLIPGFLSAESPYFYRTIGIIPAIFVLPAYAIGRIDAWMVARKAPYSGVFRALTVALLCYEATVTSYDYFVRWAPGEPAYDALHGPAADMAQALERLPAGNPVVIATDYYQHPTIRFLAPHQVGHATWIQGSETLIVPPGTGGAYYALQAGSTLPGIDMSTVFAQPPVAQGRDAANGTAYRIFKASGQAVHLPAPQFAVDNDADGTVHFDGYTVVPQSSDAPDELRVLLFWRPLQPSLRRISVFVHLEDDSGFLWAQKDNLGYFSKDWQEGTRVVSSHVVKILPGTPTVPMRLRIGFYYLDDLTTLPLAGVPPDQQQHGIDAGRVTVRRVQPPLHPGQTAAATPRLMAPGISIERVSPIAPTVQQGGSIGVTLYLDTAGPLPPGQHVRVTARSDTGAPVDLVDTVPLVTAYSPDRWEAGVVAEHHELRIGARAVSGPIKLVAELVDGDDRAVPGARSATRIGRTTVTPLPRTMTEPRPLTPLRVRVGSTFLLGGYDLTTTSLTPGGTARITLYWRDIQPSNSLYTVFMHLVDASGQLRGQHDAQPASGTWPTNAWIPGQSIQDTYEVPIDPTAPTGAYHYEVGMYDPVSGQRLQIAAADGTVIGDHVTIEGLHIP